MEIRTLGAGEREALLALLDGWPLPDGWRGRDFFRRYVEDDPSYRDENVWVAAEGGRLVACVQIFPRTLRAGGAALALGGIGSVFTRPERRRSGIASALLTSAEAAMRERGMAIGMLFTGRLAWYESLGWLRWPSARAIYLRGDRSAARPCDAELCDFDAARDLDDVKAIHAAYDAPRPGTVVRGDADWQGSLRLAGNPGEAFRVARRHGAVTAYARTTALEGHPILSEFGRRDDAAGDLAALLDTAFASGGGAFGPAPADAELEKALAERAIALRPLGDPNSMLRCLDLEALRAAAGAEPRRGESDADLLARILPPERLLFWPADRF